MNAAEWLIGLLDIAGSQPRGKRVRQCPAHSDRSPSLSVRAFPDGTASVKCHAGCSTDQVLAALRCTRTRLHQVPPVTPARYADMVGGLALTFPPVTVKPGGTPESRGFRLESVHPYGDRARLMRYRARNGDKEFVWESRPDGGPWMPGLFGGVTMATLPMYRAAEIRQAMALDEPVLLVESESSADALRGFYATTHPGGADAIPMHTVRSLLDGYRRVVLVPDSDDAGRRWHARLDAAGLAHAVIWPHPGQDARDVYQQAGPHRLRAAVENLLTRNQVAA